MIDIILESFATTLMHCYRLAFIYTHRLDLLAYLITWRGDCFALYILHILIVQVSNHELRPIIVTLSITRGILLNVPY